MVEALPIGARCIKIGQEWICNLCTNGSLESVEHGLMHCVALQEAWSNFKDLKVKSLLPLGYNSWEEILSKESHQPHDE
jgi:hypothetical protein